MGPFDKYPNGGIEPLGSTRDFEEVAAYTDNSCAFCGVRIAKNNPNLAVGALHYVIQRKEKSTTWATDFQVFFDDKINAVATCQRCHGYINAGVPDLTKVKLSETPRTFRQLLTVRDAKFTLQKSSIERWKE